MSQTSERVRREWKIGDAKRDEGLTTPEDIQRFDSRYSLKLFNVVKSMLEKKPSKRPNVKQILETSISNL